MENDDITSSEENSSEEETPTYEFSNQYLSYSDYQALGGELAEMPFNILEFEARQYIDKYSLGRLKSLPSQVDEVKLCDYKLITMLNGYKELEEGNRAVASESIDGYSYSMATIDTSTASAKNNMIREIVRTYLIDCKLDDGTPYLYRGLND